MTRKMRGVLDRMRRASRKLGRAIPEARELHTAAGQALRLPSRNAPDDAANSGHA